MMQTVGKNMRNSNELNSIGASSYKNGFDYSFIGTKIGNTFEILYDKS